MNASGIYDTYFKLTQQMHTTFAKDVSLYYVSQELTESNPDVAIYGNTSYDSEGNAVQITSFGGRQDESGQNVKETVITENIKARVYWEKSKNIAIQYGLKLDTKIFRLTTYITDVPKLKQASYILIDSQNEPNVKMRATLVDDPGPYGLGPLKFAISYWKVI